MGRNASPARHLLLARSKDLLDAEGPSLVLVLLAFLACLVCTGFHHVPGSASVCLPTHVAGSALNAELALGQSMPEPARVHKSAIAQPSSELDALEPDDVERDASPDVTAPPIAVQRAPLPPLVSKALHVASTGWMPQFLLSPALPRGPPATGC